MPHGLVSSNGRSNWKSTMKYNYPKVGKQENSATVHYQDLFGFRLSPPCPICARPWILKSWRRFTGRAAQFHCNQFAPFGPDLKWPKLFVFHSLHCASLSALGSRKPYHLRNQRWIQEHFGSFPDMNHVCKCVHVLGSSRRWTGIAERAAFIPCASITVSLQSVWFVWSRSAEVVKLWCVPFITLMGPNRHIVHLCPICWRGRSLVDFLLSCFQ